MIYPTNPEMPAQVELHPRLRSTRLSRLMARWRALRDAASGRTAERLDQLEQLVIAQGRLVNVHDSVLRRWVNESATLRDIEDRHLKKVRREQESQTKIEDEDGG